MHEKTQRYPDLSQASLEAARLICDLGREAIRGHQSFSLALAGGSTPQTLYQLLAAPPFSKKIDWSKTHIFWGDERFVPPSNPASNFSMSQKALLSQVPLPSSNLHRIETQGLTPSEAARQYEKTIREFFQDRAPAFDLILLGMGGDGHTASLFPGSRALAESSRWVTAIAEGQGEPPMARISLTLPLINQARNVLFLVSGKSKTAIANEILAVPTEAAKRYPAARVGPAENLYWFIAETA